MTINDIDKERSCKKWSPVIESKFGKYPKETIELISIYCEWMGVNITPSKIEDVIKEIDKTERISVLGKFFNPISGMIEYKLLNGKFIPISGSLSVEIHIQEVIRIFGLEFAEFYDEDSFANYASQEIEKLTDDNR